MLVWVEESSKERTRARRGLPKAKMRAYLSRVHLKLPNDLDGNLLVDAMRVLCAVDVAEGAVAHLLNQLPSFETGVSRQLALALTLLGDDSLQDIRVDFLLCLLLLLLLVDGMSRSLAGTSGHISVITTSSDGEVTLSGVCLQRLMCVDVWITHGVLVVMALLLVSSLRRSSIAMVVVVSVMLSVHIRYGGLIRR